ncbi:MAG TPA: hypothetical protein VFX76_01630 [Roseiflexaceae bacterium]|nr:hypothetical protein [Roseiflexaceae bacterium]
MVADTFKAEQTRKLLWSHAACQVGALLTWTGRYGGVRIGQGYGICRDGERPSVVIHPNSNTPEVGELALTMSGVGTKVIPRGGASYVVYLDAVADAVEIALHII